MTDQELLQTLIDGYGNADGDTEGALVHARIHALMSKLQALWDAGEAVGLMSGPVSKEMTVEIGKRSTKVVGDWNIALQALKEKARG